jgi:hypothetical protein
VKSEYVRLQVASSCLYGLLFFHHILYFLILNSFKIWAVAVAGHPRGANLPDARAMEDVAQVDVTG